MFVSIIISSKNEGVALQQTLDFMLQAEARQPFEIIVIDDGSLDSSADFLKKYPNMYDSVRLFRTKGIGLAPARNLGASKARGEILVFCDAHIKTPDYWIDILVETMKEENAHAVTPSMIDIAEGGNRTPTPGCGRTISSLIENKWLLPQRTAFEVPVLSGGCWAVERTAFAAVGGYEKAFRSYGADEEEISIKLWTFGYTLKGVPYTCIGHQFRSEAPYRIISEDVIFNYLYLAMCHYNDKRVADMREIYRDYPAAESLFQQVFTPRNIENKRNTYRKKRRYDDDWFAAKFDLPI